MELKNYLNCRWSCACGRTHQTALEDVLIGEGVIKRLPELLKKYQKQSPLLVFDPNTYQAAGQATEQILYHADIAYRSLIFHDSALVPDEKAVERLKGAVCSGCDLIVAVGAGTINDLCKYVSGRLGLDYIVVATAPSMDGYASNVAALITEQMKVTYEAPVPRAVIGDLDILCQAPEEMISAGAGDILGKYICLLDWKLATAVTGEYHCDYLDELVKKSVRAVTEQAEHLTQRSPEAVQALMEALVLSGIAMSYAGNSRPASGSEHHLSHFWEMMFLFEEKPPVLHGIKVGLGTLAAAWMYHRLAEKHPEELEPRKEFDRLQWKADIRRIYGPAAEGILRLEDSTGKNSPAQTKARGDKAKAQWPELAELIRREVPKPEALRRLLRAAGAPVRPQAVGISLEQVENGVGYAKELRNRFGLLQLLFDLNLDREFARALSVYWEEENK